MMVTSSAALTILAQRSTSLWAKIEVSSVTRAGETALDSVALASILVPPALPGVWLVGFRLAIAAA